jgi:hypothetical protein
VMYMDSEEQACYSFSVTFRFFPFRGIFCVTESGPSRILTPPSGQAWEISMVT